MKNKPLLLFIGGPTGAGKTTLAIELYLRQGWPIISADSRQIYRYLDIGTNKVPQDIQAQVPHFLIDICDPDQSYSAGIFIRDTETLISQWNTPVVQVAGGTGFYMEALLYGLDPIPPTPVEIRKQAEAWLNASGLSEIVLWLKEADPLTASKIDLSNPRRVLRAVEVLWATGKPWASFWQAQRVRRYRSVKVMLTLPRRELYASIADRTRRQIAMGWLEETLFLLQKGYTSTAPALQTLGYKECLAVLEGTLTYQSLTEAVIIANQRYARRQITWWRRFGADIWIEEENLASRIRSVEQAVFRALEAREKD
ncbi:MAG: tRNA (adenosine(37)-N6)-dimethylallyltransferase MiaA [Bacteroidia bacterium]|nr:tRNA (adenosine(37)-N6)-dimethylallyltransferase MiaA [Bacteroidia bacterium]